MRKPLNGVRVLEVAQFTYVPSAGAVLADWGAEVVKIEHPVTGDAQRGLVKVLGAAASKPGSSFAPIMEEFLFRGFMFRGWSESFLGAVLLTSLLFGINHTQYDWFERFWVGLLGLVLCVFRWRTNSTWLAVVVHSAVNIFVLFFSGPYV